MKKWQEERNYRRVRSEGGEVIANIITVDGMDVTEERSAQCAPRPTGSLAASRGERFYLRGGGVGSAARRDAVRADNETQCTGQHEEAGLLRD